MNDNENEPALIARLSERHGLSTDAVRTVFEALRSSGGTMAQFSHPEFGGMSQWSSGMTMVGDMFNDALRAKLNAVANDLSVFLRDQPAASRDQTTASRRETSYESRATGTRNFWPEDLGSPSSTGTQNHLRYAIFPEKRRLVIEDAGELTVYDSGEHHISGISQAQSSSATITFQSQHGLVRVAELKKL